MVIILLFIINAGRIRQSIEETHLVDRIMGRPIVETGSPPLAEKTSEAEGTDSTPVVTIATGESGSAEEGAEPPDEAGLAQEIAQLSAASGENAQTRERTLYFVRIDNSGDIYTVTVRRSVPLSGAPLLDTLNLLLSGPSESEAREGITSLIPAQSRIRSASVQNGAATIDFNEAFMFNENGAEGFIYQLRQVVLTATEFPTVQTVQFLIEGQRHDYLGENIPIGAPIGRN